MGLTGPMVQGWPSWGTQGFGSPCPDVPCNMHWAAGGRADVQGAPGLTSFCDPAGSSPGSHLHRRPQPILRQGYGAMLLPLPPR